MGIDEIQKMYDELYNSKLQQLQKNRDQSLGQIANNGTQINNQYNSTQSTLNQNKTDLNNQYASLFNELKDQQLQGQNKFYNDRNNASYSKERNQQAIRDYMASRNLLNSGESVDALLRSNTDFSNEMGSIRGNEDAFNKGIGDTRNKYGLEQASGISKIDNEIAQALAIRDKNLLDLETQRQNILSGYNNDLLSSKSEIDYNRIKDINTYNEQLRQEAVLKQREEEQRKWEAEQTRIEWERQVAEQKRREQVQGSSFGGGSGGSGSPNTSDKKAMTNAIANAFSSAYSKNDTSGALQVLNDSKEAVNQGYMTSTDYNELSKQYDTLVLMNKIAKSKSPTQMQGYSTIDPYKPQPRAKTLSDVLYFNSKVGRGQFRNERY